MVSSRVRDLFILGSADIFNQGGHLKPDLYNGIASLAAEYGYEAAAEVAAFEASHIEELRTFVEKEKIDCDLVITRAIDVQLSNEHSIRLKDGYDKLLHAGVVPTSDVSYIPEKDAEAVSLDSGSEGLPILTNFEFSGVKGAQGCFSYTAGHLWPYKLIVALLTRILARGANLQTHTPVSHISEERDEFGRWTIATPRGLVKAKTIVFATNAYTAALAPQYKDKIIPIRGICSRIIAPEGAPLLSNTYTIRWGPSIYDYLVPRADGSVIVGGARAAYLSDLDSWYNNVDDSKLIESVGSYFDGYMQRNFRGWENSGARTDQVWTGSKLFFAK